MSSTVIRGDSREEKIEKLVWSAKNGDLAQTKLIVENLKLDVNEAISQGRNAMSFAADMGQVEIIEYLVDTMKADPNVPDGNNMTPLLLAIYEGHAEVVKFLLSRGANKNLKAPSGQNYIDCAEDGEIKKLLL